jgi:hypothetical protein
MSRRIVTRFDNIASQRDGIALDDSIDVLLDESRTGRI